MSGTTILVFLAVAGVIFYMLRRGGGCCGMGHGNTPPGNGPESKPKDPVCGMEVEVTEAAIRSEYRGRTYYFCSENCRKRFVDSPANFHAPVAQPTARRGCCG